MPGQVRRHADDGDQGVVLEVGRHLRLRPHHQQDLCRLHNRRDILTVNTWLARAAIITSISEIVAVGRPSYRAGYAELASEMSACRGEDQTTNLVAEIMVMCWG